MSITQIPKLLDQLQGCSLTESLELIASTFPNRTAFSTSFGQEDQVITHALTQQTSPVRIFTLDTGRLFEATHEVFDATVKQLNCRIEVYFPEKDAVETLLKQKGPFSFYDSVENRKECCNIRKVVPLTRALENTDCWITGLRAEQSDGRKALPLLQWDEGFGLMKFNPLVRWTLSEVTDYLEAHRVPTNRLHRQGYVSIGCAPCTRAIEPGEDIRAGRWWWEDSKKECGLHDNQNQTHINALTTS